MDASDTEDGAGAVRVWLTYIDTHKLTHTWHETRVAGAVTMGDLSCVCIHTRADR